MALPGLSFEIVQSPEPTIGLRSDRTAIVALTERGPVETPTLVHSFAEFFQIFGCPMDGMLGPLAAEAYYKNAGQELIVTRYVAGDALPAQGQLSTVDANGLGYVIGFAARDPGAFGDGIRLRAANSVSGRAKGLADSTTEVTFSGLGSASPFSDADVGKPVRAITATSDQWSRVGAVSPLVAGVQTITLASPEIPGGATDVVIEVYQSTFSLTILQAQRANIVVAGLDLQDIGASNELLEPAGVVITSGNSVTADLPLANVTVKLTGGSDGTNGVDPGGLEASFRRCMEALALSSLPDVMIAPDLWNSSYSLKGISTLQFQSFSSETAIRLADDMVRSAATTRDRVVIVDPPLTVASGPLQPLGVTALGLWKSERVATLGDALDFAVTYSPWTRVVAGPRYKGDETLLIPPSPFVAGQLARTARRRGPWIATGNVSLEQVVGLDAALTASQQESLQDGGLNPLRMELPQGAMVQGVRSLSYPQRPLWGYISTRRLFNYLRRAITPIANSYVFEPNSQATWIQLRRDVERLLLDLFSRGALAGAQPAEAFFVKIDGTINTQDDRDNGRLNARVGVAPAFPLEFLVVRLTLGRGIVHLTEEPIAA